MDDLDHMLVWAGSCRHHQAIIQQVQRDRLAREAEVAQPKNKTISLVRNVFVAIINLLTGQ
jgi:heme exporter protein D